MSWSRREGLPQGAVVQGRYMVVRTLGQGGMGAVYLVKDRALGDRLCAMKMMQWGGRTPEERAAAVQRLEPEAAILSRLSHAGIPQIYDRFVEYGCYYLVMEFVAGVDTGRLLDRHLARYGVPLPERAVVRWALQICDVLDYLHRHDPPVLHRDLKPANLIVLKGGRVKVVDFGIAKRLTTEQGTTIGTIGYAPPEQYRGQPEVRSDLYALGASLHHLLSGRNPQAEAPFDFPPLHSLVPAISTGLVELVADLVALNPADRPQSAREVMERLSALYPRLDPYYFQDGAHELDELIGEILREDREAAGLGDAQAAGRRPSVWTGAEAICAQNAPALVSVPGPAERVYQVTGAAFSPDGRSLAVSSSRREIGLWCAADGRWEGRLVREAPGPLAFAPGGEVLASGHEDGSVQLWRLADGRPLLTLRAGGPVTAVAFSPAGQVLAAASADGCLQLWRLSDGTLVRKVPVGSASECGIAFSPDGALLAAGGSGQVRVWMTNTGQELRAVNCPAAVVPAVLFSPDGRELLAGAGDGLVRVWDLGSSRLRCALEAGPGPVRAMALSRSGLLVTAGAQVKLWDTRTGRAVAMLEGHRYPVEAAAFSPDERALVTGSYDGLRLWIVRGLEGPHPGLVMVS